MDCLTKRERQQLVDKALNLTVRSANGFYDDLRAFRRARPDDFRADPYLVATWREFCSESRRLMSMNEAGLRGAVGNGQQASADLKRLLADSERESERERASQEQSEYGKRPRERAPSETYQAVRRILEAELSSQEEKAKLSALDLDPIVLKGLKQRIREKLHRGRNA